MTTDTVPPEFNEPAFVAKQVAYFLSNFQELQMLRAMDAGQQRVMVYVLLADAAKKIEADGGEAPPLPNGESCEEALLRVAGETLRRHYPPIWEEFSQAGRQEQIEALWWMRHNRFNMLLPQPAAKPAPDAG